VSTRSEKKLAKTEEKPKETRTHRLLQPLQPRHQIIPQRVPLPLLNEPKDDFFERFGVRLGVTLRRLDVPPLGEVGGGFGGEDEGAEMGGLQWAEGREG
jgi:hypothetical protein